MNLDELEQLLAKTLDDKTMSRSERRALAEVFAGMDLSTSARAGYLNRAFRLAEGAMSRLADREVLDWLLALTKTLSTTADAERPRSKVAEVLFEPRDDAGARLRELVTGCRRSLHLCVFTITDNRLSNPILEAHRRGVDVRILTDDEKSYDTGSDIHRLHGAGVPVRWDRSPDHMHHKFGVFDGEIAVTGSYNWTRGAAERNLENILVTDDRRLVVPFIEEFERLWQSFAVPP
ncbi:MAG: phospholipase D-like domain-containing protein [Acidobacteriota bacterium]